MINIGTNQGELGYLVFYVTFLLLYAVLLVPNFAFFLTDVSPDTVADISDKMTFPSDTFIILAIPSFIVNFLTALIILTTISSTVFFFNIVLIILTIAFVWILFTRLIDALPF